MKRVLLSCRLCLPACNSIYPPAAKLTSLRSHPSPVFNPTSKSHYILESFRQAMNPEGMDDTEDDVRYNSDSAGGDHQERNGYDREKDHVHDGLRSNGEYGRDDEELVQEEEEEEDDDDEDDDEDGDGVQRIGNNIVSEGVEASMNEYDTKTEGIDFERHPKKRRLKNPISNYEFAPRVAQAHPSAITAIVPSTSAPAPAPSPLAPKQPFVGRNALADWTEHETFVLLDAWGDRFLHHGRKSLRSEEWQCVAEMVSQQSKFERTDTQCRNRLDTLKKKYKKEKAKFGAAGGQLSKWIYFRKMDMLMSPPSKQPGLSCGVDSGEYVFSNPRVYLNRANGLDEMQDSPGHSDSTEDDMYDSDGLPPRRKRPARIDNIITKSTKNCSHMELLADALHNFSKVYENVESNKTQQMAELEKMRMAFHRDIEQEKKLILERAQAEIYKIWLGDDAGNGASAENISS